MHTAFAAARFAATVVRVSLVVVAVFLDVA